MFAQCRNIHDFVRTFPTQIAAISSILLPCITLYTQRGVIADHPKMVAMIPILLTYAAYMALSIYQAMLLARSRKNSSDWDWRMRYHLRQSVYGSTPFAVFILLIGLLWKNMRPYALMASIAVLISSVVSIVFLISLTYAVEKLDLKIEIVGGPLTAASLFGVVTTTYLIVTRIMTRKNILA
jgi:hypothetical protein